MIWTWKRESIKCLLLYWIPFKRFYQQYWHIAKGRWKYQFPGEQDHNLKIRSPYKAKGCIFLNFYFDCYIILYVDLLYKKNPHLLWSLQGKKTPSIFEHNPVTVIRSFVQILDYSMVYLPLSILVLCLSPKLGIRI